MKRHVWMSINELRNSEEDLYVMRIDADTRSLLVAPAKDKWMRKFYDFYYRLKEWVR